MLEMASGKLPSSELRDMSLSMWSAGDQALKRHERALNEEESLLDTFKVKPRCNGGWMGGGW